MRADTAANCGKRIALLNDLQCFQILALCGLLDIALNADMGRASHLTGSRIKL